jgi:hypothetical protein
MQEIYHYPCCYDRSMALDGLAHLGVNSNAPLLLANIMRDVGFVDITTRMLCVPIGADRGIRL